MHCLALTELNVSSLKFSKSGEDGWKRSLKIKYINLCICPCSGVCMCKHSVGLCVHVRRCLQPLPISCCPTCDSRVPPALGLQVSLTVLTFSCGFWESNSGLLSFKGSTLHHLVPSIQYSWFRIIKCKVPLVLFNLYILRLHILSLKSNSRYSGFVGNKVIQMCKLIRN